MKFLLKDRFIRGEIFYAIYIKYNRVYADGYYAGEYTVQGESYIATQDSYNDIRVKIYKSIGGVKRGISYLQNKFRLDDELEIITLEASGLKKVAHCYHWQFDLLEEKEQ